MLHITIFFPVLSINLNNQNMNKLVTNADKPMQMCKEYLYGNRRTGIWLNFIIGLVFSSLVFIRYSHCLLFIKWLHMLHNAEIEAVWIEV